ncbi:2363_t:CDS:2, partial [Acaulospora colombiana]
MVSTPKVTEKKVTSNTDQNELTFEDSKMNMMSAFYQYMYEPTMKSGIANDTTLFDEWMVNDLEFFPEGEDSLKFPETPSMSYDVSPIMSSSITTPSMVFDNIPTPQTLVDSPLFGSIPTSFSTSPTLEPPLGFFPNLISESEVAKSLIHLPSVAIPTDDHSMSINIPWGSDANNPSSIINNEAASFVALTNGASNLPNNLTNNTKVGSGNSSPAVAEVEKDPEIHAEELAIKRAKNTDAARRSRLRKVMKMESLEKQVSELKDDNNELQTRIAVLESEKKGLEEKNAEKDNR